MEFDEQSLKVYEIMTVPVITAFEEDDIKSVASKMLKHRIGSLIVTNKKGNEVGIITQGDIIRYFASDGDIMHSKAFEVMSAPLICIDGGKTLEDAARKMADYRVKKLCVKDANNKMVGIVTDNDIMKNASYLIDVLKEVIVSGYIK